ncbi:thermonuclease family protein [Finegoldia magna]|uniref:thermonuclease family protein n=1 Tax=Finegoldia magna TaxID=1260 RepID=UPI00370D958C
MKTFLKVIGIIILVCIVISLVPYLLIFAGIGGLIYSAVKYFKTKELKKYGMYFGGSSLAIILGIILIIWFSSNSEQTAKKQELQKANSVVSTVDKPKVEENKEEAKEKAEEKESTVNNDDTSIFETAKVISITDGDTIVVDINGKTEKLRFIGIDTPETHHPNKPVQHFGKEASDYTTKQLTNKTIYLQKDVSERDKYRRLLRYVWLIKPSTNEPSKEEVIANCFNAELVKNGYAHAYTYPPDVKYNEIFKELEAKAREKHIGLWNNENPDSENSKEIVVNEKINQRYIADTKEGVIKGNRNSRIYHMPGQRSYNKISKKNVVYFKTEEEAKAAGYRPAKR